MDYGYQIYGDIESLNIENVPYVPQKAGLRKIRVHDLRHTYATLRITKGDNVADVSKQLGHHSVKFTMDIYYHWIPGGNKSEVDGLDDQEIGCNHPQPIRNQQKRDHSTKAATP
jgi:integrase